MAEYGDILYRESIYGSEERSYIPINITDLGYEETASGDKANISVHIGPMTGYPAGSRVAVMRSYTFYPPNPGRLISSVVNDVITYVPNGTKIIDTVIPSEGYVTLRSGMAPLNDVPLGSTLYLAVYVSEPMKDSANNTLWSPWILRGRNHWIVPGNRGGVAAAIDSMPRGVLTGGIVYGEVDASSPTAVFIRSLGYVIDSIVTEGETISALPEKMNVKMVLPLLRGMGMSDVEEAFYMDDLVFHRLKNILFAYPFIHRMKGALASISSYVEAATGIPCSVTGPDNLILTVEDGCPDEGDPTRSAEVRSTTFSGATLACVEARVTINGVTSNPQSFKRPIRPFLSDNVTKDKWWDEYNHSSSEDSLYPHVSGYYELTLDSTSLDPNTGTLPWYGSKAGMANAIPVQENEKFFFRFRAATRSNSMNLQPSITFYDEHGNSLSSVVGAAVTIAKDGEWHDVSMTATSPVDTAFLSWKVSMDSLDGNKVALGVFQLSNHALSHYRDPRSVVVALNTGQSNTRTSWPTMDSTSVTMGSYSTTMDAGIPATDAAHLDRFEALLVKKLIPTLDAYLPPGVSANVILPTDSEFPMHYTGL